MSQRSPLPVGFSLTQSKTSVPHPLPPEPTLSECIWSKSLPKQTLLPHPVHSRPLLPTPTFASVVANCASQPFRPEITYNRIPTGPVPRSTSLNGDRKIPLLPDPSVVNSSPASLSQSIRIKRDSNLVHTSSHCIPRQFLSGELFTLISFSSSVKVPNRSLFLNAKKPVPLFNTDEISRINSTLFYKPIITCKNLNTENWIKARNNSKNSSQLFKSHLKTKTQNSTVKTFNRFLPLEIRDEDESVLVSPLNFTTTSKNPKNFKIKNKNHKNVSKEERLSDDLFKLSKTMCSVLKCTHHLNLVNSECLPKQVLGQVKGLGKFPKPFSSTPEVFQQIKSIAQDWGRSLCKILSSHYTCTRNKALSSLESFYCVPESDWKKSLQVALTWTTSSFGSDKQDSWKEGLNLIEISRKKSIAQIPSSEESFLPNRITLDKERSVLAEEACPLSNPEEAPVSQSSINLVSLNSVAKKLWRLPSSLTTSKLLVTDETFQGPVPNDFTHLIFPNCKIWDFYKIVTDSVIPNDLTLILIHLGYSSLNCSQTWAYVRTALNKLKLKCPNSKIFFTNLISSVINPDLDRFNKFCIESLDGHFINIDSRNLEFRDTLDKSEKLLQEWLNKITSLNC